MSNRFTVYKDGGQYRASFEIEPDPATGDRRFIKRRGRTKTEARERLAEAVKEYEATGHVSDSRNVPTLGEWLDQWLEDIAKPRLRPSTFATYQSVVKANVKPAIGAVKIDALAPKHFRMLERYITKGDKSATPPRKPKSSATASSAWRTLHAALDDAVKEGLIASNPCDRADSPRVIYNSRSTMTPAQAGRMIAAEEDAMWHLMWRLAFETGMRQGERFGLTPSEIRTIDGRPCIVVEQQLKTYAGVDVEDIPAFLNARHVSGSAYLVPPKTNSGRRVIPISESLHNELTAYMSGRRGLKPDELIFVQRKGKAKGAPLTRMIEERAWSAALEHAGIEGHYVPHSARHTAATAMAQLGMTDNARKLVMGHSSADVTNNIYTHLGVEDIAQASSGVSDLIERGVAQPSASKQVGDSFQDLVGTFAAMLPQLSEDQKNVFRAMLGIPLGPVVVDSAA
ncbi:tyrosine-type recombinase/integrase [Bifidobacterium sp. SMB2]|uniref:Tyrosine-type recombinase/integrase n=1 Tax=Bifidobacterium saimiriisciurei TaxID=2661627 RepID=A0ABX0C8S6_9BIFI|nr:MULTISPECIES: tyrosine-type recombinase/integrase [Bifidobacterium]NEG95674.1 tyrosine-type recombinase/integrase [Bifidobacterium sp. SMB2]NEH11101.1 tyrosine-type recombinase/integrase [Bifidobacterium saimiriisciurei]